MKIEHLSHEERIRREADNEVWVYLDGLERGKLPTRETKQMIESIVATDYDGRTLIELLQNAHDAHPADSRDGRVFVKLDLGRGEHGTLYVANGGQPFRHKDFESICRIALSSKRPDEGIGNKGVGFKSVLQLSTRPTVFSKAKRASRQFDGYCFRFADEVDIDVIAARVDPRRTGLADEIRANISNLKLPVPAVVSDPLVAELGRKDYSTVVVLPLRSNSAAAAARRMIDQLLGDEAPFNLFLDRLAAIEFVLPDEHGNPREPIVQTLRIEQQPGLEHVEVESVWLNDVEYARFSRVVDVDAVNRAIELSRKSGRMGDNWGDWQEPAQVSIAVRVGEQVEGRLYTFLPMGASAVPPLGAFVNAPFFAHLNRRDMEATVPLNALFLDAVAQIAADVLVAVDREEIELVDPSIAIDLLSWRSAEMGRLKKADWVSAGPATVRSIPSEGGGRTSLSDGWTWAHDDVDVVTAETLRSVCGVDLFDTRIGEIRMMRLASSAQALEVRIEPEARLVSSWAEDIARSLVERHAEPGEWAAFYDDLAKLLPKPSDLPDPPRVVVDEAGELMRDEASTGGTAVFFHPQASDDSDVNVAVPTVLRQRLRFTNPQIPHRAGQQSRPGREWLGKGLVARYESAAVLRLTGDLSREASLETERWDLLRFAYELWLGAREKPTNALRQARILLPVKSGWAPANETILGRGWSGSEGESGQLFEAFVEDCSGLSESLDEVAGRILVGPDAWAGALQGLAPTAGFLIACGVTHGLPLITAPRTKLRGEDVNRRSIPSWIATQGLDADERDLWVGAAKRSAVGAVRFSTTDYTSDPLALLTGQREYHLFNEAQRLSFAGLVLAGMATWTATAMRTVFRRNTDHYASSTWPSPAAAFLMDTEWVPQRVPGERGKIEFRRPADAWWAGRDAPPAFLPCQPPALTYGATPDAIRELEFLGVRMWSDKATAAGRLGLIEGIVADHPPRRFIPSLRNAYEEAWSDSLSREDPQTRSRLVAQRADSLTLVELDGSTPVYLPVPDGEHQEQLLTQTALPVVPFRERQIGKSVADLYRSQGNDQVRTTAAAEVVVTVDGMDARDVPSVAIDSRWPWLPDLVLAVVEFKSSDFRRVGETALRRVARVVRSARFTVVEELSTLVDGHRVDSSAGGQGAVAVEIDDGVLVLVPRQIESGDDWRLAESIAGPLMNRVGYPELSAELEVALIRLQRASEGDGVSAAQLAASVDVSAREYLDATEHQRSLRAELPENVEPLLAALNPELARLHAEQPLESVESLARWLGTHAADLGVPPEMFVKWMLHPDIETAAREIGIELASLNRALAEFGRESIDRSDTHRRQLRAFVHANRDELVGRLRASFLSTYRDGADLTEYLELRDGLDQLEPPPGVGQTKWDLTEHDCRTWVEERLPVAHAQELLPLAELQSRARSVITGTLTQAAPVVEAWCHAQNMERPILPNGGEVLGSLDAAGRLDFDELTSADIVIWLADRGQWPESMPRTLVLQDLKLNQGDLESARQRQREERERERRQIEGVRLGVDLYDEADIGDLIERVLSEIPQGLRDASPEPLVLAALDARLPAPKRIPSGEGGSKTGPERPTSQKTMGIGYLGELRASQWIELHYGVRPADCWKSTNRVRTCGGAGDDSLGYDFLVVTSEATIMFEVKATTGDDMSFELGETEVRQGQRLEDGDDYQIIHITHVSDPDKTDLRVLPNPFRAGGFDHYRIIGRSLRLRYEPVPRDDD